MSVPDLLIVVPVEASVLRTGQHETLVPGSRFPGGTDHPLECFRIYGACLTGVATAVVVRDGAVSYSDFCGTT